MPKKSGLVSQREREIGRRVQIVRERINWPQPAFAAEMDISRDRLASIEYARTPLRYPVGYRLCTLFDINPEWLANGTGEMASSLALPDLPMPEGLPSKAMFSRVYDQHAASRPLSARKKLARKARGKDDEEEIIPGFDPALHVIRNLTELFAKERFGSPLERQEFALELTSYARELALRLRRDGTRQRALTASDLRGTSPKHADLAGIASKNAALLSQLRDGIRRLNQEIDKLDEAMQSLSTVAIDPSRLPRPSAIEVARLEDAMEKIARQIGEAEVKIKALMTRGVPASSA